jgi:hypothetical protein
MGKRIKLSNGRRLVEDIIHVANKTPLAGFSADQDAGLVAKFRRHSRPKISWNVLYMKAYAIVCKRDATLRRSYVNFPWSCLYEHDQNVCMMTIAREHEGEERLFFARFNSPEERTLVELQDQFDHYRRAPISDNFATRLILQRHRDLQDVLHGGRWPISGQKSEPVIWVRLG